MTTQEMIFTKAAASRIFGGIYPQQVDEIREFKYAVWVKLTGCRPMFVSKKRFLKDFADLRKEGGTKVSFIHCNLEDQEFIAAGSNGKAYEVRIEGRKSTCECKDFRMQKEQRLAKIACCKHIYGALYKLGYSSFRQYLEVNGL